MTVAADMQTEIRLRRRVMMGRKPIRRRRPPAQVIGRGLIAAYAKELKRLVDETRLSLQPLMDELDTLLSTARAERRVDAGEGRRISQLIEAAAERMRRQTNAAQVEDLAREFARRTSTAQRIQLNRQLRATLGVDLFTPDTRLAPLMDGFVAQNVGLIKDIPRKIISDVESTVTNALTSGKTRKDIAGELQKKFKIGKKRANLIARDQIGKFHGQLNATRQKELGVTRFIWRSANDERVRPLHEDYDGQTFSYASPPADGLPGEPINCRCYAEPVMEDILNA